MSGWKIVVDWFLPPPLVLTAFLLLPCPEVVKRGILKFVQHFLFYRIAGPYKLVHVALLVAAILFAACGITTYNLARAPLPETLTPNQKTAILARRWREERNFWISTLCFLLWGLLYRFYQRELEHMELRRQLRQLSASESYGRSGGSVGEGASAKQAARGKAAAVKGEELVEPSAPPASADMLDDVKEPKKSK